jgi:hypothetical protein
MTEKETHSTAEFAKVFSSSRPLEVEAATSLLEEAGIVSFKIDKKDSSYIFGEIELYVNEEDLTQATMILIENELL